MFVVIDCPEPSYIDCLRDKNILNSQAAQNAKLHFMVHLLGPGVWSDPRYQQWMQQFDPQVFVIIIVSLPLKSDL